VPGKESCLPGEGVIIHACRWGAKKRSRSRTAKDRREKEGLNPSEYRGGERPSQKEGNKASPYPVRRAGVEGKTFHSFKEVERLEQ